MINNRPILKDQTMKASSTDRNFQNRVVEAESFRRTEEELELGIGPNLPGWEEILEKNRAKTVAEHAYHGISAKDTEITQRIVAASERPAQTWEDKGKATLEEAKELKAQEAKKVTGLKRMWRTAEQELAYLTERMSEDFSS